MESIKSYQEQVQEVVEKAITAVEEQYKVVADASFGYADKIYNLDSVKTKHDDVATKAYDKARDVNKLVGEYAGDLISKFEKPEAPAKKPAAKKKPVAKKKAAPKAKPVVKTTKSTAAEAATA